VGLRRRISPSQLQSQVDKNFVVWNFTGDINGPHNNIEVDIWHSAAGLRRRIPPSQLKSQVDNNFAVRNFTGDTISYLRSFRRYGDINTLKSPRTIRGAAEGCIGYWRVLKALYLWIWAYITSLSPIIVKKIRHFGPRGPRKSDAFFVFGKNLGMASLQNSLPTLINNIKQIIYFHVNL
jgi:hypothetical protein